MTSFFIGLIIVIAVAGIFYAVKRSKSNKVTGGSTGTGGSINPKPNTKLK